MRIAVFTDTFFPQVNGVVNAVRNFNKTLTKKGHEIQVFTSGKKPGVSTLDGAEIHRYRAFTFIPYPEFEYSIDFINPTGDALKFKPEIVHAHTPFIMGFCAWRTAKKLKSPLVGTFHTPIDGYVMYIAKRSKLLQKILGKIAKTYQDWFYNKCDVIVVPARSAAIYIDIKGKEIFPVSNGVDLSRYGPEGRQEFRDRYGLGNGPVILHGGRLSFEKRIDYVIKAMPIILKNVPDAKLLIVGSGPARKSLEQTAEERGVESSVVFTGYISDEEFPKAFAAADVLALNSPVETQSLIVIEALATGIPVVGADAGAIPDAVVPGVNGYLFKPDDIEAMAGHIITILSDDGLRMKLKQGAIKTASEHSLENCAGRLMEVYEFALKKKDKK
ncbi:glycosyltransferase family 4 protein [Methanocella sp. CWC-04]|uniref:Glycosyltransferase family 4 protein n=2 Tax=Methanooceanicella nereidis TaxID=2052831 RepID=A0AAP2RD51_9EURY|nr:glycosyltransferase family 4 protein [Methanocella sp. CWC-04]